MNDGNDKMPTSDDMARMDRQEQAVKKKHLVPALMTLVVLLALATGFLTYLMVNEETEPSNSNSTNTVISEPAEEDNQLDDAPTVADNMTEYMNEGYGFSFSYPSEWGSVSVDEREGEQGSYIVGTFDDRSALEFSAATTDFQPFGRDGACSVASFITIRSGATLDQYRRKAGQSTYVDDESAPKSQEYKTIVATIEDSDTVHIYESFEAGEVTGLGSCLGYFAAGYVMDPDFNSTVGLSFSLSTPLNQASSMSPIIIEDYEANKEFYVDQDLRKGFVDMIKSTKAQ